MIASAPRIDPRIRRAARRLARRSASAADIHRRVGAYAERIDVPRPSYQQICMIVNETRLQWEARRATAELLLQVELGARPITDLLRLLEE